MMRRLVVCVGMFAVLGAFPALSASASKPTAHATSFANLKKAVNTAARRGAEVISNSYGAYGSDCTGMSAYNHVHVAITVSAGDSGYGVACPAVLNTVISVGGTTLNLNGDGSY